MASIKLSETKDGRRFYQIIVSRGRGQSPYKTRWYWPDGWSAKVAEREATKQAALFERACRNGEVLNRSQKKALVAEREAEAAKLKTLQQYADGVFLAAKKITLSENAIESYTMNLTKHVYPVLGDILLVDITPAQITKLLLDFQNNHAHASCIKLFNILNGLFKMAFLDDSIPQNPMAKVRRPTPKKGELGDTGEKALTTAEVVRLLDCAEREPLKWRVFLHIALDTGARRGEIGGLQWQDIDFKNGAITIQRNLQYTPQAGTFITSPKNGKSRMVDIGMETVDLLKQLRDEQSRSCISKWVFTQDGTAEPMHPDSPTRYLRKFAARYGFDGLHPHLLRHTAASIAITNGADIESLSERLGHSDTSVTLRIYTHGNSESIRRVGDIVRGAVTAARKAGNE